MIFARRHATRLAVMLLMIVLSIAPLYAQLDPIPLPPPPDDAPITTPDPTVEVTPDPESTAEVTLTPEPTVEVTPDPESTAEVTPEPTGEVTPDVTPQVTPEPASQLLPYDATKVFGVLADLLAAYNSGGPAAADAVAAQYYVTFNANGRTPMQVYGVPTTSIDALRTDLQALGAPKGSPTDYGIGLYVNLSLAEAAALSLSPNVAGVRLTPSLASAETLPSEASRSAPRAPVGTEATVGYTLLGTEAWHRAGYTGGVDGDRVNIAVIDVGFGTTNVVDTDIACYRGSTITFAYPSDAAPAAGDSFRGRYMAEVICDIAPGSNVRFYKATTANQLAAAINAAASGGNDIIVIGVDLGVNVAAGDGGQSGVASVYTAIANAKNSGIVVIGAAGDNGKAQKTFTFNSSPASLTIKAGPGDRVNVGWNGWSDTSNISGTLGPAGGSRTTGAEPGFQITVPSCTPDANGLCTFTLTLTTSDAIGKTVQVQVLTTKTKVGTDKTFVNGIEVTLDSGGTLIANAGNIARPADSPNVIAVGAVCASVDNRYAATAYSAKGPIFAAGGVFGGLPSLPYKRGDVKPDVVSAAHVSVNAGGGLLVASGNPCNTGFGGSQASAAHVAGMAALLLQNTTNSAFQTLAAHDRVRDYLQQRSFDLPFNAADGFDMQFGAGFATLGSPTFDYDTFLATAAPTTSPNRLPTSANCTGGTLYVGQYNYGSPSMNGALATPYHSIMQAVKIASATPNTCVVVVGGEYATPLFFTNLTNPVQVFGYSSVVRELVAPSIINVLNALRPDPLVTGDTRGRHGAVVFNGSGGHTLYGFTFNELSIPDSSGKVVDDVLPQASAVVVYNAPNVIVSHNTFNNFTQRRGSSGDGALVTVAYGQGARVANNIFSGNTSAQTYPPTSPATYEGQLMLVNVDASGTSANPVRVENNTFSNNVGVFGSYLVSDTIVDISNNTGPSDVVPFYPLVRGLNSYVDFVNNQFVGNEFETLLAVVTSRVSGTTANSVYRIFGNAFVANTAKTRELNAFAGPIINLFNAPNTYIVNNTFANNKLDSNGGVAASIIGRGTGVDYNRNFAPNNISGGDYRSFTGSINDATFDVHNNVFFRNDLAFSGAIVKDIGVFTVNFTKDCRSATTPSVLQSGATNNFAYRNAPNAADGQNNVAASDCQGALNNSANNNRLTVNPLPLDENFIPTGDTRYFLSDTLTGTDPNSAGYYMMIPAVGTGADQTQDGVDAGNMAIINTLFPAFLSGEDARGVTRVIDSGSGAVIDLGAFEYTPLALTQEDFAVSFNEDSGPYTLNIAPFIDGGFPPYTIVVNQYPQYYGTSSDANCGVNFPSTARGMIAAALDADNVLLTYCPPDDFHTNTALTTFNTSGRVITFTVRDSTNASVSGTVTYTVNPVDDPNLSVTIGDNSPSGDVQVVGVALNGTTTVRARPWVSFTRNFVFSERTNTLETALQDQTDYDYTYSNIALINGTCPNGVPSDPNMPLPTVTDGRFVFTLPPSITSSIVSCFSYDVSDTGGGTSTGNILIVKALEAPAAFNLVSPGVDTLPAPTIGSRYDVGTLVWSKPTNLANFAATFTVTVTATSTNFVVIDQSGLTPAADSDRLTCDATTCTYTLSALERDALLPGTYEWTVTAFNDTLGTEASNAPFYFQITAQEQLIRNGNFQEAGTKATLAKFWTLTPSSGISAKRICTTGGPSNCFFAMIGKAGTNIVLRQNAFARGDAGDLLVFSGSVKRNKAQGGTIQAIVTYTNNKTAAMTYNVPKGTGNFVTFTRQLVLTGTVKSIRVQAVTKGLGGRFDVDDMSLTLTRDQSFSLLAPLNNTVVSTNDGVVTPYLNRLVWKETEDVSAYYLTLSRLQPTPAVIYDAQLFTAAADSDPLTCKNDLCVFLIPAGTLDTVATENRLFQWNVTGSNNVTAQNGPFTFTVRGTERELLANGNLDVRNPKTKLPQGWKTLGRVADKMLCSNAAAHAWPSYQGACLYQFVGKNVAGFNSRLTRTIPTSKLTAEGVNEGDTITLRFVASGAKVADKAARVIAKITLTNNQVRNIVVVMPKGNFGYTNFVGSYKLAAGETPKTIDVTAQYTGKSGSYKIDNISVAFEAGTVNP